MRVAILTLALLAGCGMRRVPGPAPGSAEAFGVTVEDLRRVRIGMGQSEVQTICGPPHAVEAGTTWRVAFVIFGLPDTWRYVYRYRGAGRVAFSCGIYYRDCSATAVEIDVGEPG